MNSNRNYNMDDVAAAGRTVNDENGLLLSVTNNTTSSLTIISNRLANLTTDDGYCLTTILNSSLQDLPKDVRWRFLLHAYLFGCMFIILFIYSLSSVIHIHSTSRSQQISKNGGRFLSVINAFLLVLGLTRAICLFVDPYGFSMILPRWMFRGLWSVGFPLITSAFSSLLLTVLHFTKLRIGSSMLRSERCIRLVTSAHLFGTLLMAIVIFDNNNYYYCSSSSETTIISEFKMITTNVVWQCVSIGWSVFVYSWFLSIGYQIFGQLDQHRLTAAASNRPIAGAPTADFYNNNKGLMQMMMLAPAQSNLASSVTAALMPTILRSAVAATASTNKPSSTDPIIIPSVVAANDTNNDLTTTTIRLTTAPATSKMKKLRWQSSISNTTMSDQQPRTVSKKCAIVRCEQSILKGPPLTTTTIVKEQPVADKLVIRTDVQSPPHDHPKDEEQQSGPDNDDLLLQTILNHIAYVNRTNSTQLGYGYGGQSTGQNALLPPPPPVSNRTGQVRTVLTIACAIAIAGLSLSILHAFRNIFLPYYYYYHRHNDNTSVGSVNVWYWLMFQTLCRICEITMAGSMANLAKQSASSVDVHRRRSAVIIKQREAIFI